MAERSYDLTAHQSKPLDAVDGSFGAVVTMGCGDGCPAIAARRCEDSALPDQRDIDDDGYRRVRDEIETRESPAGVAVTPLPRRLGAEFFGTALLLATVVGSGVMGMDLSDGNRGVALLANASATAGILYVLIVLLGPISGAHMNPAVSLIFRLRGELGIRELAGYTLAQVAGAVAGVVLAHLMFGLDVIQPGDHIRSGPAQWLSEGVATSGLVVTILVGVRQRPAAVPALVAAYIFAAYWFTASTSFANPAVTLARSITQTFAGIRPDDVPGFVAAQFAGALLGLVVSTMLVGSVEAKADS